MEPATVASVGHYYSVMDPICDDTYFALKA
jgi:hypothetical protein